MPLFPPRTSKLLAGPALALPLALGLTVGCGGGGGGSTAANPRPLPAPGTRTDENRSRQDGSTPAPLPPLPMPTVAELEAQRQARLGEANSAAAARLHREALARLDSVLSRNESWSNHGFTLNLTTEYWLAEPVVRAAARRTPAPGAYGVNYDYLLADPYLRYHNLSIDQMVPGDVDDSALRQIMAHLSTALEATEFVSEVENLAAIRLRIAGADPSVARTTRKRIRRLFDDAQRRTAAGERPQELTTLATPLEELAVRLSRNEGRCIDGIQRGLEQIEGQVFGQGGAVHLGEFISQVLADDRQAFIERHTELSASVEFRATVTGVLHQRMLYALGLRGGVAPVAYPFCANPSHPILAADQVMNRFLNGERLPDGLTFEPYNVDRMVRLLQESWERGLGTRQGPGRKLTPLQLREECVVPETLDDSGENYVNRDPVLGPELSRIELSQDPAVHAANRHILPATDGNPSHYRLTREFWLYLLQKYGYIVRG